MAKPIKVGLKLYEVLVDDLTGKCEMLIWEVRTIRSGKATAIQRNRWTWTKLSSRNGDFGWAKTIDPLWRKSWLVSEPTPKGLNTTKKRAWHKILADANAGRLYIDDKAVVDGVVMTARRMSQQRTTGRPRVDVPA